MNPTPKNPLPKLFGPRCDDWIPGTDIRCTLPGGHDCAHRGSGVVWSYEPAESPKRKESLEDYCGTAPGTDCATVSGVHPGMAVREGSCEKAQVEPQRCNDVSRNLNPPMRCTRELGHCGNHEFRYGKADTDPKPDLEETSAAAKMIRQLQNRVKELSVPLCIGREVIGILAREGQYLTDDGRGLAAADGLFRQDPYAQIDALRTALTEENRHLRQAIADRERLRMGSQHLSNELRAVSEERQALHKELGNRIDTIDKQDAYRKELKKGADYFRWLAHSVAGMIWRETQSQGPVNLGSPDAESGELMDRLGALLASLKKSKPLASYEGAQTREEMKEDEARAVDNVIRSLHDGICPACGTIATYPHHHFNGEDVVDDFCPHCGFAISREVAKAGLALSGSLFTGDFEIFQHWLGNHQMAEGAKADLAAQELVNKSGNATP